MNAYITLDGYKYKTLATDWASIPIVLSTVKDMLDGSTQVTFGGVAKTSWAGTIKAPVAVVSGWGTITTLRTTLLKLTTVSFTDHYGDTRNVLVKATQPEESLTPSWDATSNVFSQRVQITEVLS